MLRRSGLEKFRSFKCIHGYAQIFFLSKNLRSLSRGFAETSVEVDVELFFLRCVSQNTASTDVA